MKQKSTACFVAELMTMTKTPSIETAKILVNRQNSLRQNSPKKAEKTVPEKVVPTKHIVKSVHTN